MPSRKRPKKSRLRGSHTHGWGEKKKHRHAGHRGGRGRAGTGKRADQKKTLYWAEGRKMKHGFVSRSQVKHNPINIGDITLMIEHNKFEKKGAVYEINLTALGYTKLLSKGAVKYPMQITVDAATEKAAKKVAEKSGKVIASTSSEQ